MNGIVASRLVERFGRPVVLIAKSQDGWKGSGRSVSAFDLHGALGACVDHLERFGGHRAAAGLSIAEEQLEAFADAFAAHADSVLTDDDLRPLTIVDAIVPARGAHARARRRARPARAVRARQPGRDIARAELRGLRRGRRRGGQAPSLPGAPARPGRRQRDRVRHGLAARPAAPRVAATTSLCRLKENRWNGTVAPQLVVRRLLDAPERYEELRDWLAGSGGAARPRGRAEARPIFAELGLERAGRSASCSSRRRSARCSSAKRSHAPRRPSAAAGRQGGLPAERAGGRPLDDPRGARRRRVAPCPRRSDGRPARGARKSRPYTASAAV